MGSSFSNSPLCYRFFMEGYVLGYTATFRLYLRNSKGEKRIARLMDSPNLPDGEAIFSVTTEGLKN